jgi:hypothetical protein
MRQEAEAGMMQAFDFLFLLYLGSISLLTFLYREGVPLWSSILGKNAVIFLLWLLVVWAGERRPRGLVGFVRNWYFCAGIPIVFTELQFLIHAVRPTDLDPLLARLDYVLFGLNPTVWLESWARPWLTALLQVCYLLYFFLPLPLGAVLYANKREDFFTLVTTLGLMFLISFLGYLTVPALGPRFELASLHQAPLRGTGFTDAVIRWLDAAEGANRDCFPSGHVAMAVVVCAVSYRLWRPAFPVYVLLSTGLLVGTVYLRYHYVVDLPAGILLAVLCLAAGPRFHRAWQQAMEKSAWAAWRSFRGAAG